MNGAERNPTSVAVDWEKCQGHGKCYLVAPDVFTPDENDDWGRAAVLVPDISGDDPRLLGSARDAQSSCPERAISLDQPTR